MLGRPLTFVRDVLVVRLAVGMGGRAALWGAV